MVYFEEYIMLMWFQKVPLTFSLTEIFLNQNDDNTKVIYLWGDPTLVAKRP